MALGNDVRGTVHSLGSADAVPLRRLPHGGEQLELVEADLIESGSFVPAVAGCHTVFHVASPFVSTASDPAQDLVAPAVKGTMNVLRACLSAPTVKRVVLTSSIAAIVSRATGKPPSEDDWNEHSTATTIFLSPLVFSGEMFSLELPESLGDAMGDGHWRSAAYALWDSVLVVGLSLFLVTFFRTVVNRPGAFGRYQARSGYAVYIVYIPVVVFVAAALRGVEADYLLKVGLAAAISIPLCWVLAYPILRIPGEAKIL